MVEQKERNKKISKSLLGHKHSEETKIKISKRKKSYYTNLRKKGISIKNISWSEKAKAKGRERRKQNPILYKKYGKEVIESFIGEYGNGMHICEAIHKYNIPSIGIGYYIIRQRKKGNI